MIYIKLDEGQEEIVYATYPVGNSVMLRTRFEFKLPLIPEHYLIPINTSVWLLDNNLRQISVFDSNVVDINWQNISLEDLPADGYLFFETTFLTNADDFSNIEKYLKKCETIYGIHTTIQGYKEYNMFDSVSLTNDKKELFMRKYIILKR